MICFDTVEAERLGLPKPDSWQDLLDPVYKGHIVMPNPSSSGTGYLDVWSWLELFGEDEGWLPGASAPDSRRHTATAQSSFGRGQGRLRNA